jgi:hypothetical protein
MVSDLWQAVCHGKQRRTKTRSQKAEEEGTAEACREPADESSHIHPSRAHPSHAQALNRPRVCFVPVEVYCRDEAQSLDVAPWDAAAGFCFSFQPACW